MASTAQPRDDGAAGPGRQALYAEDELQIAERRGEARLIEQGAAELRRAAEIIPRGLAAEGGEHIAAEGHHQIAHPRQSGVAEGGFDDTREEGLLFDEHALDVALPVAPHLAEQHEVAAVEQAHLEGIDIAFEGGDAKAARSLGSPAFSRDDMACSGRALCSFLAPRSAVRPSSLRITVRGALADLGLNALSVMATVWALRQTGSVFLGIWCFFLVQALFVAIPPAMQRKKRGPGEPAAEDRFQEAYRVAESALRNLTSVH